jgi:hypothetical protein
MNKKLIPIFCMLLACISCQKELTPDNPGTPAFNGGTQQGLLVKLLERRSAADSTVYTFTYDASKRITALYKSFVSATLGSISYWIKYNRDASGKIIQVVTKTVFPTPGMPDTTVYTLFFAPGNNRFYAAKRLYTVLAGTPAYDSTAYTYDAGGRVVSRHSFLSNLATGQYYSYDKLNYTYDANGNLLTIGTYANSGPTTGTFSNPYDWITYEYDTQKAPLFIGNEAFINAESSLALKEDIMLSWVSKNNMTKYSFKTPNSLPPTNINGTFNYTYDADGKPVTATGIFSGTNYTTTNLFFYYN